MSRRQYACRDPESLRVAQQAETHRIVNVLELAGFVWPAERPRTVQKLYDAMCEVRGVDPSLHQGLANQWAAIRRWVADTTQTAAPRQLPPFKPYVMPVGMREAIQRAHERVGQGGAS